MQAISLTFELEVEFFFSGLKDFITVEAKLPSPIDLTAAMSLACTYEQRTGLSKASLLHYFLPQPPPYFRSGHHPDPLATAMQKLSIREIPLTSARIVL